MTLCSETLLYLFTETISFKYLHMFLLIFEYYPSTLSILFSYYKLSSYSLTTESFNLNFGSLININLLNQLKDISSNISQILFILIPTIISFLFYLVYLVHFGPLRSLFVNFYDILLFRYCNIYVFGLYFSVLFNTTIGILEDTIFNV